MTAPKLALTRPAALTGRVGQGGDNRVHDVALVQALLGAKRARGGRPYMAGNVTGKYDKETAVALLRYRMDQRDGSIKQPLARSGPMLNRLAQGQSLAVLVGTAKPYSYATMAEAGPIKGPEAAKLSAERKVELMQVMRELTRDWGIAFDVEIKAVTGSARSVASALFDSRPLVPHFTPRKFAVHGGQRLSPVMSTTMFRDRVKELHDPLAADIKVALRRGLRDRGPSGREDSRAPEGRSRLRRAHRPGGRRGIGPVLVGDRPQRGSHAGGTIPGELLGRQRCRP